MPPRITASEFQKHFGRYHDKALQEPVVIKKHNRPSVVVVSYEEYERLKQRDRQVYAAHETPAHWLEALETAEIPVEEQYSTDDLK